mgnify:CR=1 FL=1
MPQSNQRGIETKISLSRLILQEDGPQSNQRGIETVRKSMAAAAAATPQSNQRGIETEVHLGLVQWDPPAPQSNQRGIETRFSTAPIFKL